MVFINPPMNHDPLLQALEFLGRFHGKPVNPAGAVQGLPTPNGLLTPELFERAAQRCGFTSRIIKRSLQQLHHATLPAILLLENGDVVVLIGFTKGSKGKIAQVSVSSSGGGIQEVETRLIKSVYTGYAILVKPTYEFETRADFEPEPPKKNWFWGTLWRFRGFYARVGFATIMVNLLAIASSLFIMNVYDRVVPNQAIDTLLALAAGAVAAFLLEFSLKSLRTYLVDRAGHRIDLILGGDLFSKVLGMQFGSRPASAGALAGQARSYEGLREFFTSATISALFDLPFVFIFAGIVYLLGGPVAIPLLAGAALALIFSALMQFPIARAVNSSYMASNQRQGLFVEGVNSLETIKSTRSESELQAKMEENVHIAAKADGKSRICSQFALNMTTFLQQLVTVGIVIVAFFEVQKEAMTMGAMIACVILAGRAMAPLTMISSLLTRLQLSRRALKGLNQIMQAPSERQDRGAQYISLDSFRPQISAVGAGFDYGEDTGSVLRDLNFSIQPGERVAILGQIGCGKSTLLRLMMGLYFPTAGRIDMSGVDTRQIDPAELRRHIGYVPQDPSPLFGSIRSNLKAGAPWVSDEAAWKAVQRAGLADYIRSLPRGVDHSVAEGGKSLSGGQRQALCLARALLEEPGLLILDEPTSSIDFTSEQQLLKQLDLYLQEDPGRTLVVATHKRSVLSIVERIIVIEKGQVIADGPKDQVLRQQGARPAQPQPQTQPQPPVAQFHPHPAPAADVALYAEHSPTPASGAPVRSQGPLQAQPDSSSQDFPSSFTPPGRV